MVSCIKIDGVSEKAFLELLKRRSQEVGQNVTEVVKQIIEQVRESGDGALFEYTRAFDQVNLKELEVEKAEMEKALEQADPKFISALMKAKENIIAYHQNQKQSGYELKQEDGIILGRKVRALERVGLYVPGGKAAYPSSVLMNAIPAKIAGVKELIMVSPAGKDGKIPQDILAAAAISEVDRIFLVGGAQAVAALAFGTESIPKVDKIVGPGNIFVATAKKMLFGTVDIDMIAGPSEILIIADKSADPVFLAADLMSQAEHDALASSILITTSEEIANQTIKEMERQIQKLERREIIESSLKDFGAVFICDKIEQAVNLANEIAPEHLELMIKEPFAVLDQIINAGSVFLGAFSPEPLGDYFAGTNHVLPTGGSARFFSPLSVEDFLKKSSYIYYTKEALERAKDEIVLIAEKEGLTAHANAIQVRF